MIIENFTNPLGVYPVIETGTNVDDYTFIGIYAFDYACRPTGLPSSANGNGWLIVLPAKSNNYCKQIWIALGTNITAANRNDIFMRGQFGANSWSDWVRIPTESVST